MLFVVVTGTHFEGTCGERQEIVLKSEFISGLLLFDVLVLMLCKELYQVYCFVFVFHGSLE